LENEILLQIVNKLDKLDQRFDKLEQRFDKLEQRLDKLEQRFDKLEQRVAKLEQGQARLEQELAETRNDVRRLNQSVAVLESDLTFKVNIVYENVVGIINRDKKIDKLENLIENHDDRIFALEQFAKASNQ
jgi:chromosome segregation ATPase